MLNKRKRQELVEAFLQARIMELVSAHNFGSHTERFNSGFVWGMSSAMSIVGIHTVELESQGQEWYGTHCPGRFDGCKTGCKECGKFAQSVARRIK